MVGSGRVLIVGLISRLPFPALVLELWVLKPGVAIAVTLNVCYKTVKNCNNVCWPWVPCLVLVSKWYKKSGHINSYEVAQGRLPYIQPRGWNPHACCYFKHSLQLYLMPKRLARITRAYHKGNKVSGAALKAARNATSRKQAETLFKALWDMR